MFDNKNEGAKYIQLYNYYKNLILSGILKSNDKIPSIRKCAESFELSRTTVETAYEMLGAEGYIVIGGMAAEAVKSKAITIENGSEAGRLLDIDVLTMKGGISRTKLGFEQRKCLLCDKPAKECARSQRHSMEELLAEVDRIAESL